MLTRREFLATAACAVASGARAWKALVPSDGAGVSNVLAVRLLDDGRSYAYSYERELSQLLVVSGLR
jgi:hypothetical protein